MITGYKNQTVTHKDTIGRDAYGKPILNDEVSIQCRFHPKRVEGRDATGNEYIYDAMMWADDTLEMEDVVTYEEQNYKVIGKDTKIDFDGTQLHTKYKLIKTEE